MITGQLKSQIDAIWDTFWSGGISNPMSVVEQMTFLLFLKRLDDLHTAEEAKSNRLKKPIANPVFKEGDKGVGGQLCRWSRFKNLPPNQMFEVVQQQAFPFMKTVGGEGSSYARHMKDAIFLIPSAAMLAKVVDMLDKVPLQDRDTKGDVYEYMLGKIAQAGTNGQFRTPRHIISMMVDLVAPRPTDIIADPACGTAGFLVMAGEYLRRQHPEILSDPKLFKHFQEGMFHGYDFDATMLRIGSMNMMLHGIESPDISYRDSLKKDQDHEEERFTVILANPPFKGSLDETSTSPKLLQTVKTKKTELLFLALFLRLLKKGGRAAVVVPDGVLFGSSGAHKAIRKELVEKQKLDGVISMPSGVFKPYAGVSTAILIFTRTDSGGTENVWFYDMEADGFSLDDKRTELDHAKHEHDNIPDIVSRWSERAGKETKRARTEQSFTVPKQEIAANDYDLSVSRYREVVHEQVRHTPPAEIIAELKKIEAEIADGLEELEGMLS
jgi:type I restriction enzyme M protein